MDEERFNLDTRKFLKTFGVNAQREIEKAVRAALESGTLRGDESLGARATLSIDGLDVDVSVEGRIGLGGEG
ncbi:MAG: DUF6494 family protein [Longimicrobiales bacterium]